MNTVKETQYVWLLTETAYAGQCTGFDTQTSNLAIFSHKPTMPELASYLGGHLSSDMGRAISQVSELLETGSLGNDELCLTRIELNKPI